MLDAGINVAFGHDCVMDPWYSYGTHDMLDVAHMGDHVAQMTGLTQMAQAYQAVTENGARALGLDDYGLAVGKLVDLVILQASSVVEALQLRPARLYVIRRGRVIAKTPAAVPRVMLEDALLVLNIWTTNDNALYAAGLGLRHLRVGAVAR